MLRTVRLLPSCGRASYPLKIHQMTSISIGLLPAKYNNYGKRFLSYVAPARIDHTDQSLDYTYQKQDEISKTMEVNLQELENRGFTVIKDVFTKEETKQLFADFARLKTKADHILKHTPPKTRQWTESGIATESQYWRPDKDTVILQAGKGRFDFYRGFADGMLGSDAVLHNKAIERIVKQLLIDDYSNYNGVVHSTAGSENQYWHRDTDVLTNTGSDGSKLVLMDDFYFTCLIPMTVPITVENGGTEFMVGSHRLSADKFDGVHQAMVEVPLGSALLFNGKINHRGTANRSNEDRPVIYQVYHKRWYNDQFRKGIDEV